MKYNLEKNKGITLVVLVITIIVLIILAAVVITTLRGDNGIIDRAQEAKEDYSTASENEEGMLDNYIANSNPWKTKRNLQVDNSIYDALYEDGKGNMTVVGSDGGVKFTLTGMGHEEHSSDFLDSMGENLDVKDNTVTVIMGENCMRWTINGTNEILVSFSSDGR